LSSIQSAVSSLSPFVSWSADLQTALTEKDVQRFRGGLVFKAHRLCVSLNSRLESNKEEEEDLVLHPVSFIESEPQGAREHRALLDSHRVLLWIFVLHLM